MAPSICFQVSLRHYNRTHRHLMMSYT